MAIDDQKLFFVSALRHNALSKALWEVATDSDSLNGDHKAYFLAAADLAFATVLAEIRIEITKRAEAGRKMADECRIAAEGLRQAGWDTTERQLRAALAEWDALEAAP